VVGYVMLVKFSLGSVRVLKDRLVKVCKRTLFAGFKFFFERRKILCQKLNLITSSKVQSLCRKHDRKSEDLQCY
jgi:hypothetical protein